MLLPLNGCRWFRRYVIHEKRAIKQLDEHGHALFGGAIKQALDLGINIIYVINVFGNTSIKDYFEKEDTINELNLLKKLYSSGKNLNWL